MNLAKINLLRSIQQYIVPSTQTINAFLSTVSNDFIAISNLFLESHVKIKSNNIIHMYIWKFLNRCNFFKQYIHAEQEWYKFYVLLKTYNTSNQNTQEIYNMFQALPPLYTKKQEILWINYQVKTIMLSYYFILNEDIQILIQDIDNIPKEIKDLSY